MGKRGTSSGLPANDRWICRWHGEEAQAATSTTSGRLTGPRYCGRQRGERRSRYAFNVKSLGVFGSYLGERNELNDLDIVFEMDGRWSPGVDGSFMAAVDR